MKNTTSTKWNDIKSKITMCGLLVLKDGESIERKMLSCVPDDDGEAFCIRSNESGYPCRM